ncbi:MAG TPA: hypothetical protein VGR78_00665 [Verrucomicrobiae bacterium]|jgi:hypothetical protein|nr:hypothetical protein [Verrucomicrobiae bacterium]
METREHNELEQFIHRQLQKLPEREAPEDLLTNVMAAVRARENRPWWKQPFTSWPRGMQTLLFIALGAVFGAVVYFGAKPAEAVSLDMVTERASSLSWIATLFNSLADYALLAFQNLSWEWFLAIGTAFSAMYAACIAAGVALYRVTSSAATRG